MSSPANETDAPVTFINVFDIPPENVDAFLPAWRERAAIMAAKPGCLEFTLHRAIRTETTFQLVNVAQFTDAASWHAAVADPAFQALRDAASGHNTAHPGLYRPAVTKDDVEPDTAASPAT